MIINALYIINNDVDAHAPNPKGERFGSIGILVHIFNYSSGVPPWAGLLSSKRYKKNTFFDKKIGKKMIL